MKVKPGDRIKVRGMWGGYEIYEVVEFRQTLGIFKYPEAKEAESLTPLCELYERGPESENSYAPNYGEYTTNMVPAFIIIAKSI